MSKKRQPSEPIRLRLCLEIAEALQREFRIRDAERWDTDKAARLVDA